MRGEYEQLKIWSFLRASGPQTAPEIAKRLDCSRKAVSLVLARMRKDGTVVGLGPNNKMVYSPTNKRPKDMRGKSPGCAYGRTFAGKPEHVAIAVAARMALVAKGWVRVSGHYAPELRPPKQSSLHGKTALELCWRGSVSTCEAQQVECVQNMHKPEANPWASAVETPEDKEAA